MKMIAHERKPEHVHEVKLAQLIDQIQQIVVVPVLNRQTLQGSSGNYVIYGRAVLANKSGYPCHFYLLG
jgi:hypothetical protein